MFFNKTEIPLITFGVILIIGTFIAFIVANDYVTKNYTGLTSTIYSVIVGIINGIVITIFTLIYNYVCIKACNYENHQYDVQYQSSYVFKRCFFDFVISYINLFYYAFFIRDLTVLSSNFISIIISKNLIFIGLVE